MYFAPQLHSIFLNFTYFFNHQNQYKRLISMPIHYNCLILHDFCIQKALVLFLSNQEKAKIREIGWRKATGLFSKSDISL